MVQRLGPLLELLHLSASGRIPNPGHWLTLDGSAPFVVALEQREEAWVSSIHPYAGFIRAARHGFDANSRFTAFLMAAKRAGQDVSGLPPAVAGQLVAAMEELENNIHEHSDSTETGIVAYRAEPGAFEFIVADHGIGILRSLRRCKAYAAVPDEGRALETALTDGVSRHGPHTKHGYGFRPIFTGLVKLHGELRFRSGDHALTMSGLSPGLATARIAQKSVIDGFFASIRCYARPAIRDERVQTCAGIFSGTW
jgi:anti-sigma regulatory factor (Ser/Thr protein kinase)